MRYWFRFKEQDGSWSPWMEVSEGFYRSHRESWDTEVTTTERDVP